MFAASKLPFSLKLSHPVKQDVTITVEGMNHDIATGKPGALQGMDGRGLSVHGDFRVTGDIPDQFVTDFLAVNKDFTPYVNGAIAFGKTEKDVIAAMREKEKVATGLEPINPKTPGNGVEPAKEE